MSSILQQQKSVWIYFSCLCMSAIMICCTDQNNLKAVCWDVGNFQCIMNVSIMIDVFNAVYYSVIACHLTRTDRLSFNGLYFQYTWINTLIRFTFSAVSKLSHVRYLSQRGLNPIRLSQAGIQPMGARWPAHLTNSAPLTIRLYVSSPDKQHIHSVRGKGATLFLTITLAFLGRFLPFFHQWK